ncbi:ATP synthase gamma chain [Endomicrobiia bacterium]|uniref:ATP synthase gamma chain n=1 Tax=Endomicrobium trichonymphae TaxID=1408204 RepID=B1H0B6_ENDTX|nr:ATP synthase F1 subunit gamma [Candidatus Endomicrobium trichonymphae]GHT04126.1 ATP synthase gamma chain [Endomicrobiia bacterium]BAG13948.1 FoF1-type ATP synthase gamma subunit [Candidatus Endomicrobium trichonymphae]BAV58975.1 F0F1-type ATP synthase gamma subunit [Candidatus Endomicrobium trichonymphae]GHT10907.1 ATP synthase gamma chain [Endomicrobiia bacterium]GHT15940.1 ATP synthase gamma chain [Endomicrobiia bacterium]
MAQNLQQLKKRIKTSDSIAQIAKAMEMIAASKIRKAQNYVEKHNPYARKIKYMVQRILTDKDLYDEIEKFSKERKGKRLIYIISPDKGLCGGLVVNLFKKVSFNVQSSDYVVAIGKKSANDATRYNYNVLASFGMGTSFPKYDDIYPIIDIAKKLYISGEVTKVSVIYTEFKNMLVQKPAIEEILPVKPDKSFKENKMDYIFEPDPQQVLEDLLPYYFEVEFYSAFMNAYASEQAARMTAMKNAKDNANDISASLTNIYNKSRQEKITNEILDLANGQQEI